MLVKSSTSITMICHSDGGDKISLTFDEKRRYFISECKQKKTMLKMLVETKKKIEADGERDDLIMEKESLTMRLNYINNVISSIRDPIARNYIECLWINGYGKKKTSVLNNNVNESAIYQTIKKELMKVL